MGAISNETQTTTEENNEKSSWAKFFLRRGINPNLLMLKMTLFVMHGGKKRKRHGVDKLYLTSVLHKHVLSAV